MVNMESHFGAARALVFVTAGLALAACSTPPDRFPCGMAGDDGGDKVCDGENEVCVCEVNRCAKRDPTCPESNLRYVFKLLGEGEDNCVDLGHAQSAIDQLSLPEDSRACPVSIQPECGALDADGKLLSCGTDQLCSCAEFRCAERYTRCGSSGWRWSTTEVCLTSEASMDLESMQPNTTTGLCNGVGYPEMCGVPGLQGLATTCPAGSTCICEVLACGTKNPGCASGWAYANEFDVASDSDGCILDPGDSGGTGGDEFPTIPQASGLCADWE
jgi:hypothetical protein